MKWYHQRDGEGDPEYLERVARMAKGSSLSFRLGGRAQLGRRLRADEQPETKADQFSVYGTPRVWSTPDVVAFMVEQGWHDVRVLVPRPPCPGKGLAGYRHPAD